MNNPIIKLFEAVQSISYRCRNPSPIELSLGLTYANCSQKRDLLKQELNKIGFKVRELDAIFDWRDLPIPQEITRLLKESGTLQKHHLLGLEIEGQDLKVDPTWDLSLELFGFPVTKSWNGYEDTKQVTDGKIIYYDPSLQRISLPYFLEERKIFAIEFNKWIGR